MNTNYSLQPFKLLFHNFMRMVLKQLFWWCRIWLQAAPGACFAVRAVPEPVSFDVLGCRFICPYGPRQSLFAKRTGPKIFIIHCNRIALDELKEKKAL